MDSATGAFAASVTTKQNLDQIISGGKPVKDILGAMISATDEAQKLLRAARCQEVRSKLLGGFCCHERSACNQLFLYFFMPPTFISRACDNK
jgi:hypothetical protein